MASGKDLVHGERQAMYGHPFVNMMRLGRLWGAILGIPDVPPEVAGLMMQSLKQSREVNTHQEDNLDDLDGYTEVIRLTRDHPDFDERKWDTDLADFMYKRVRQRLIRECGVDIDALPRSTSVVDIKKRVEAADAAGEGDPGLAEPVHGDAVDDPRGHDAPLCGEGVPNPPRQESQCRILAGPPLQEVS